MFFKPTKDDKRTTWTKHVKEKMRFYGLSETRLRRVLSNPKRKEVGIAPGTIAVMQPAGSVKYPTEIWLMYQKTGKKIKIITAWRYPGQSPVREPPPIPEDILQDLTDEGVEQSLKEVREGKVVGPFDNTKDLMESLSK